MKKCRDQTSSLNAYLCAIKWRDHILRSIVRQQRILQLFSLQLCPIFPKTRDIALIDLLVFPMGHLSSFSWISVHGVKRARGERNARWELKVYICEKKSIEIDLIEFSNDHLYEVSIIAKNTLKMFPDCFTVVLFQVLQLERIRTDHSL